MADEQTTTDTQTNPTAGNADQPATSNTAPAPGLTAEQVKAMIEEATQKAFNSGAAAARREEQAKASKKPNGKPGDAPNEPTPSPTTQPSAPVDGFALSEAMAEFSLTKDQRKKIRDLASKENPDNLDEFVAQWAGLFGAKPASPSGTQAQPNNTPSSQQQPQSQPPKPNAPNAPAPSATPDRDLDTPFKEMGEDAARDTWQAYVRRKGANPANPYDPRNRPLWREMRNKLEAGLSTASVQFGPRRG